MKLSKLEAYRIFLMDYHVQMLSIRFNGNTEELTKELDRIWLEHCSKIDKLPRSGHTLIFMKQVISDSKYLSKYLPT
jgi:hypothetical protein